MYTLEYYSAKKEWNDLICRKMNGTGNYHVKRSKSHWKRQISHILSHMQNPDLRKGEWHKYKMRGRFRGGNQPDGEWWNEKGEGEWIWPNYFIWIMKTEYLNLLKLFKNGIQGIKKKGWIWTKYIICKDGNKTICTNMMH
jgi:hypothetical protein